MSERSRLAAVEGLAKTELPKPPPRKPANEPTASQGPGSTAQKAVEPSGPRLVKTPPSRPKSATSGGGKRPVVFTVPDPVERRFREAARSTPNTTLADLLLNAVETNVDDLTELVADEQARVASPLPEASGIFPASEDARIRRREPHRRITIALRTANVEVIDRLVQVHKAESRSQLLTAALRAVYGEPVD